MKKRSLFAVVMPVFLAVGYGVAPASASLGAGVGNVPQKTQTDDAYEGSFATKGVVNVDATTQRTSCFTPEVPYATTDGPAEGYSGESDCSGASTTGEDLGPYSTQKTSNPGYPATTPKLVKDHSESDIRVDPTNPSHLIGSSKWFVSPEGYNHELGFYESFDGGQTWPVQGHIPGYEGWTDNTDPVGAFDGFGNYYEFLLNYQFFYNSDGSHNFNLGTMKEPNPGEPAEVVAVAVHPAVSNVSKRTKQTQTATNWISTHNGGPDFVATYDSIGNEPDKQWIAIDDNPKSPHYNRIYVMWVDFHFIPPAPFVSFADAKADGTHTDWVKPIPLPMGPHHPNGDTYLLPHVTPDGNVYTTLTNETVASGFTANSVVLDRSTDGGANWSTISNVITNVTGPVFCCDNNTTFRDGIFDTFTTSPVLVNGHYPLYVSWEDDSAGFINVILSASLDGGFTWSAPIQVNDNWAGTKPAMTDEFQPNLTTAANGTVSVAFYDRRLSCPSAGEDATNAGLALDTVNANYNPATQGPLPPYGFTNYCVNASIQFYMPNLTPIGHNIRISEHTWDPQLNSAHYSRASLDKTFIGDYFGNATGPTIRPNISASGLTDYTTSVSTYDDGSNPNYQQQQIVATVAVP